MGARLRVKSTDGVSTKYCPIVTTIRTVVTESRLLVVRHLLDGPKRFNELIRVSGINSKTLSVTLKFLEGKGIVKREIISTRPFSVQYSLTRSGLELSPAFEAIGNWGIKWLAELNGNKFGNDYGTVSQKIPNK